ncbi:SUR7-domain-containing protein [Piedraia hortae CBS 480.64]|uniref:SUR7-domain-containing protein n=1 Tax=Piedraia hortae CBS 480.64 TaxID=1314780 RepID=A0A6A7C459_9PEZI|nr:SUR7-domain-containing protein [Piedraia hortae CBS 480.64]
MAIARPLLSLLSIILLAGGTLLTIFIVLSGSHKYTPPINRTYFLEASTNGFGPGSPHLHNPARWTWLSICGVENNKNAHCGPIRAAQSFDPVRNFGTRDGVPQPFLKHRTFWYYMSRFTWVWYLLSLLFAAIALVVSALALCTRLGAYITALAVWVALFFQTLAAAMHTAWVVKARHAFRSNGQKARIGQYAMAFAWSTVACYFLATLLFCIGGKASKRSAGSSPSSTSRFGRKKRNQGTFADNTQARVKDDYA